MNAAKIGGQQKYRMKENIARETFAIIRNIRNTQLVFWLFTSSKVDIIIVFHHVSIFYLFVSFVSVFQILSGSKIILTMTSIAVTTFSNSRSG